MEEITIKKYKCTICGEVCENYRTIDKCEKCHIPKKDLSIKATIDYTPLNPWPKLIRILDSTSGETMTYKIL